MKKNKRNSRMEAESDTFNGTIDKNIFIKKHDKSSIGIIDEMIENHQKEIKKLRQLKRVIKKEKSKSTRKKPKKIVHTGFTKACPVPKKIRKFLDIDKYVLLSRIDVSKMIHSVLRNRGLLCDKDKRVYRVDSDVMKLFDLDETVNKINDPKNKNGFNMYNIQTKIASCYH